MTALETKIFLGNGEKIALGVGLHNITFFATNNFGTAKKTIYFSINNSIFEVLYNNFSGSPETTQFIFLTFEEMQSLQHIVLENSSFGKIEFKEIINITDDFIEDNLLDLDNNIRISYNSIFLNSTSLSNFNKDSVLTFYNVSFRNPMLLRDGVACGSFCIISSHDYFGNTISYNVPGFSTYSLIETPQEIIDVSIGGGGGGGVVVTNIEDLELKDTMNVIVTRGQVTNAGIPIENSGDASLHILVSSDMNELIKINKTEYFIRSRDSSLILLDFFADENFPIGVYTGKIFLDFQGKIREILVTVEVKALSSTFEVDVKIPDRYKQILVGENILTQTQVWNFEKVDGLDIELTHIIKDIDGNEITSFEKLLTVGTQSNFIDEIFLPKLKPGKYFLYTQIRHENIYASSSDEFIITESILEDTSKLLFLIIGIIILSIIILFIVFYRRRKNPKRLLRRIYKHKYD